MRVGDKYSLFLPCYSNLVCGFWAELYTALVKSKKFPVFPLVITEMFLIAAAAARRRMPAVLMKPLDNARTERAQ